MILPNPDHLFPAGASHTARPGATAAPTPVGPDTAEQRAVTALVTRAQAGDLAAQSEIVHRYQRRLAGHIRQIIRQPDAVEDVVQTVFIKMLQRIHRLRDPAAFESWLFRLSRNSALDFIRRRNRRPASCGGEDQLQEIPDRDSARPVAEIMEALDLALQELSPKDRTLVTMFIQGHSYRIIAAQEGLTEEAVKARLHRTRPFLRATVGRTADRIKDFGLRSGTTRLAA
jgi:RNA polymerase sigma-70 factor, ECF subfamily